MDFVALLMFLSLAAPPDQSPPLPPPAFTATLHPQNPALRPLRQQAEAGNADAQFNLGIAWINGSTGTVDYEKARYWWEKAAAQGQRIAQYNLGVLYDEGRSVSQDYRLAAQWYRKSAQQGFISAQYNLGNLYRDGKGVPQNAYIARDWQEKAAAQGDRDAMYALGSLYRHGALGISGDGQYTLAFYWLEQAAMRGQPQAQAELADLYARGEGVARDPGTAAKWQQAAATAQTGAENTDNSSLSAIEQTERAAMRGEPQAQVALANHYARGDDVARDVDAALKWWQVAAAQGSTAAMQALARHYRDAAYNLAHLYHYGDGVPRSDIIAHYWLNKAVGHERDAMTALGMLYQKSGTDDGTQMRASYWLEQAAMRDDAQAQYELSWRYRYAYGLEKNQEIANRWLQQAAENGNVEAQYRLGVCYYHGCFAGFRQDKRTGREWLEKAAAQGDSDMQFQVGMEYYFGRDYDDARRWLQSVVTSESGYDSMAFSLLDSINHAQGKKCPAAPANTVAPPRDAAAKTPRDPTAEAAEWQRRAEAGDAGAQYQLYFRYSLGEGVKQDQETANRWLQQAAENGDAKAQYWLGELYHDGGPGFGKDRAAAFIWLEKAAAQGGRAEQSHIGWRYYANGDYDNARRWLQKAADQCDSTAQFYLKKIDGLQRGKHPPAPPRDAAAETAVLQQKAEAGGARAQYLLSFRYRQGDGVAKNQETTNYWLRRAAVGGDVYAQYRLGEYYYDGTMGFRKDKTAARQWLDKAAAQGDRSIQFHVGWRYYFNNDYDDARRWLQPVAASDSAYASVAASLLDSIDRLTATKQASPIDTEATLRQHAEAGDAEAQGLHPCHYAEPNSARAEYRRQCEAAPSDASVQTRLGRQYYDSGDIAAARHWLQQAADGGSFVVPDLLMIQTGQCFKDIYPVFEAFDTLRQKAKAGDATAQYRLSLRHLAGAHQNRREAAYWLQQAAENGDRDAQYWLGQHYYHGSSGYPQDRVAAHQNRREAAYWLQQAAENGDRDAQYWLGQHYYHGSSGYPQDRVAAHQWLNKAAEAGGRDTRHQVGMTYFHGNEYVAARYWLQRAADQGNPQAPFILRALTP